MATIRIFDPTYMFPLSGAAARPVGTQSPRALLFGYEAGFIGDEATRQVVLRVEAAPGGSFSGSPSAGFGGVVGRIAAYEGVAAAQAADPDGLVFEIVNLGGLTLAEYVAGADGVVFADVDRIEVVGGEIREASNLLRLLRAEGPADIVVGSEGVDDLLEVDVAEADLVSAPDAAEPGAIRLFRREEGTLQEVATARDVERLLLAGGTELEVAGLNDKAPVVEDVTLGAVDVMEETGNLSGELLAAAMGFRIDPATLPDAPAVRLAVSTVTGTPDDAPVMLDAATGEVTVGLEIPRLVALAEDEPGEVTFTYRVSDGIGQSGTATATVPVIGVNDPVEFDRDAANEDGGLAFDVTLTANPTGEQVFEGTLAFSDADVMDMHYVLEPRTVSEDIAGGSFRTFGVMSSVTEVDGSLSWEYRPDATAAAALARLPAGEEAANTYRVSVGDRMPGEGPGTSDTVDLVITFDGVNDAPVFVADPEQSESDIEGTVPMSLGGGELAFSDTGELTFFDPDLGDELDYRVIPLSGDFLGEIATRSDTDPDANGFATVEWVYTVDPERLVALDGTATETFRVIATDDSNAMAETMVTITLVGNIDTPLALDDSFTATEAEGEIILDVLANDIAGEDETLRLDAARIGAPDFGDVQIGEDGVLRYIPDGSVAAGEEEVDEFTYALVGSDGEATVSVVVTGENDAPMLRGGDSVLAGEIPGSGDGSAAPLSVSGALDFSDADQTNTHRAPTPEAQEGYIGEFELEPPTTTANTTDGSVEWTLTVTEEELAELGDMTVEQTYEITVSDFDSAGDEAQGGSLTETVTVTITGIDPTPPPVIDDGDDGTSDLTGAVPTDPEGTLTDDGPIFFEDGDNAESVDADFEARGTGYLGIFALGDPSIEADGVRGELRWTFTVTPEELARLGPDGDTQVYDVTLTDADMQTDTTSVTITLSSTNAAPIAVDDAITVIAGEGGAINLLENDSDPDGDPIELVGIDTRRLAEATVTPDGRLSFETGRTFDMLSRGETETLFVPYTISDPSQQTDSAVLTITVEGANGAPVIDEPVSDLEGEVPRIVMTGGGTGADGLEVFFDDSGQIFASDPDMGDVLSVSDTPVGPGYVGSFDTVIAPEGIVTWSFSVDPAVLGALDGTPTQTYAVRVTDQEGLFDSATVTITLNATNRPPIAVDDMETVQEGSGLVVIGVLANDSDPDGDEIVVDPALLDTSGTRGTVTIDDLGRVIYDPGNVFEELDAGELASDSFVYGIADPFGLTDTAVVRISVEGVNSCPLAADDSAATFTRVPVTIDVLANDTDPEPGDSLSVESISIDPAIGTAVADDDGNIVYTPSGSVIDAIPPGDIQTVSFTYTVSDGDCADIATVFVDVDGTPQNIVTSLSDVSNPDDGVVTLREAVRTASDVFDLDGDGEAVDRITFDPSLVSGGGTVELAGSQIIVDSPIVIDGGTAGPVTIDANGASRAFFFRSTSDGSTIENVTITDGRAPTGESGGAVRSNADLTLRDVVITGSTTVDPDATSGSGGAVAIANASTLTIVDSVFSGNSANFLGGAIFGFDNTVIDITGSTIEGNSAGAGGGIGTNPDVTVLVNMSTIRMNTTSSTPDASGSGAGVLVNDRNTLEITESFIHDNTASGVDPSGGGIAADPDSTVLIERSQIFSNQLDISSTTIGAGGGGVFMKNAGSLEIIDSLVFDNMVTGEVANGGGVLLDSAAVATISGSDIFGNQAIGPTADGGGIAVGEDGSLTLIDTDVRDNSAERTGGGVSAEDFTEPAGFVFPELSLLGTSAVFDNTALEFPNIETDEFTFV